MTRIIAVCCCLLLTGCAGHSVSSDKRGELGFWERSVGCYSWDRKTWHAGWACWPIEATDVVETIIIVGDGAT